MVKNKSNADAENALFIIFFIIPYKMVLYVTSLYSDTKDNEDEIRLNWNKYNKNEININNEK